MMADFSIDKDQQCRNRVTIDNFGGWGKCKKAKDHNGPCSVHGYTHGAPSRPYTVADRYLDRLRSALRKMNHPGHLLTQLEISRRFAQLEPC